MGEKNLRDEGENNKIMEFDDGEEKVADDETLQSRQNANVEMIGLESDL
jgi:hypothetical protein